MQARVEGSVVHTLQALGALTDQNCTILPSALAMIRVWPPETFAVSHTGAPRLHMPADVSDSMHMLALPTRLILDKLT